MVLLITTVIAVSAWAPPTPPRAFTALASSPLRHRTPISIQPRHHQRLQRLKPRPAAAAAAASAAAAAATTSSISFPASLAGGPLAALATGLQASPWWTWTMLLLASTAGVAAERTRLGAALSSPLITMGVALIACNIGLLPAAAPVRFAYIRISMYK